MPIVLTQPQVSSTVRKSRPIMSSEALEFIVFCPKCGTLETVWFAEDGLIVPTRKFSQEDARIYHDCGANVPCHLYRTS
jgi:hypothetical protein